MKSKSESFANEALNFPANSPDSYSTRERIKIPDCDDHNDRQDAYCDAGDDADLSGRT